MTRYDSPGDLSAEVILDRIIVMLGSQVNPNLDFLQLHQRLHQQVFCRNWGATTDYLEVAEPGSSRMSFDWNLYDMATTMAQLWSLWEACFDYFKLPQEPCQEFLASIPSDRLGHWAAGTHRTGIEFITVYHGVELRHGKS